MQALQIGLEPVTRAQLRRNAADFWSLGRWTVLANSLGLITGVGYFWTLRVFQGLIATAAFAIVALPLKLANPVLLGTANLLIPAVSAATTPEVCKPPGAPHCDTAGWEPLSCFRIFSC